MVFRYQIESLLEITGQKVVLTSHSYGENVARSFLHWADERSPGWLDAHVEAHIAIAGTTLGVPKAVTAVLSGGSTLTLDIHNFHVLVWVLISVSVGMGVSKRVGPCHTCACPVSFSLLCLQLVPDLHSIGEGIRTSVYT